MKSAIIYLFSATGNTEKVSQLFREEMLKYGYETVIHPVEAGVDGDSMPDRFDRICFAYPVHGFNAPLIMTGFAETLPEANGKEYYIIKTSGEPAPANRASSSQLNAILQKKGYVMMDEFHYVMPYNMLFRHSQDMVDMMWGRAKDAVEFDAGRIAKGVKADIKQLKRHRFISHIFRIEHKGMQWLGRHYKVDTEKCIGCNKCLINCPMSNISKVGDKFVFGNKCLGCAKCFFNCPADAIKPSLLTRWKVNGAYRIGAVAPYDESKICKWCNKSYKRYFANKGGNSIENYR